LDFGVNPTGDSLELFSRSKSLAFWTSLVYLLNLLYLEKKGGGLKEGVMVMKGQ